MLSIGAKAANFDLIGVCKGETSRYRLSDHRARWLVLFFYPADFSFICPTEVTGFQRLLPQFAACGCGVLGASVDSPETHLSWAKELGGIDYPLLSDTERLASRAYDVLDPQDQRALRASFVIDPGGVIEYALVSHRNVGRNVEETLRVVRALQTGRSCPADWRPGDLTSKEP
jgi:peroxiredoxin (alkyl hydroperoxide reductase subunit C)